MLPNTPITDQRGFTLIELLVVILIIGILAAIALHSFLPQVARAQDANAKEDVRNAVSQMESCFRSDEAYTGCPDAFHRLAVNVAVTVTPDGSSYVVTTTSDTGTVFTIKRLATGYSRICDPPGDAGCRSDSSW